MRRARESGELEVIVKPHVNDPLRTGLAKRFEKCRASFFVKPMEDIFIGNPVGEVTACEHGGA